MIKKLLLLLFISIAVSSCSNNTKQAPKAVKGVLDLRNWDFEKDGIVKLDGEWEFYWNEFKTINDFNSTDMKHYVLIPDTWNMYKINDKSLSGKGYASYYLRILTKRNVSLSFKIEPLGTCYLLLLNNKDIGKNGTVGKDELTSIPEFKSQVIKIDEKSDTLDLILWVSNYHYRKGGIWNSVIIGNELEIDYSHTINVTLDIIQVGGCIFLSLYLLILFFHRKNELHTLMTAICLIFTLIRILTTHEYYITYIFPELSWDVVVKLEIGSLYIAFIFYILIAYSLFKDSFNKIIIYSIVSTLIIFSLIVILFSTYIMSYTVPFAQIVLVFTELFIVFSCIKAIKLNHDGAGVILFAYLVSIISTVNDLLFINNLINTFMSNTYALLFMTLCTIFVLSKKFSKEFIKIENLTVELTKHKEELEIKVEERTLELKNEKEKSDKLLLNVLPEQIATRLKSGETQIADHFEEASVIFIDIVDFTKMSAKSSPQKMVNMLNDIFSIFDKISAKYGLEKIKTIGDCYMAAAGIPVPRKDHAQAIALMALEVMETMKGYSYSSDDFKSSDESNIINFRIGLDCGPIVAGVIGEQKFIYDLWGDMVNTASRMETNGVVGKIQCTERFKTSVISHQSAVNSRKLVLKQTNYNSLTTNDYFHFVERGEIEVKGKGMMRTWFLIRKYSIY